MSDASIYRIVFKDGRTRYYSRSGMASAVSNPYRIMPILRIERMPFGTWLDVTSEFLKGSK